MARARKSSKAVEVEIGAHEKNPYLVVLKRLVEKAPKEETTFPKGLSVKDVTVKDGIASVDFNDVFLSRRHNDYDNTMMVYAVVNTLTEFKDVKSQISRGRQTGRGPRSDGPF